MEREGEVNPSILPDFKKLQTELSNYEAQCIEARKQNVEDAFLLFHVSRSSRMILEIVGRKFAEAKEKHENPAVVDLSKMIIPCLNDLYNMIMPIKLDKEHRLSESERTLILQRLKSTRDVASIAKMLPTIEDEKRGVSKTDLRNRFISIADSLQATLDEE
jgi:hypothetical protein